ncbi:MAG: hypothetical protein WAQ52_03735 [Terriglobales bacterium]
MKHIVIATVFAMVLGLAALAQTTPGTPQPSGTSPSTQPQTSPSQAPDMSSSGNQNPAGDSKGEKKMKGCIESAGGKYMLEDKHGKEVALGGSQDFASHVGHTVTVHGTFANGSDASSGASATSSNSGMSASGGQFIVSKLDMVSESCNIDKVRNNKDYDNNSKPNPNHK